MWVSVAIIFNLRSAEKKAIEEPVIEKPENREPTVEEAALKPKYRIIIGCIPLEIKNGEEPFI
jgi:hypothetical protein